MITGHTLTTGLTSLQNKTLFVCLQNDISDENQRLEPRFFFFSTWFDFFFQQKQEIDFITLFLVANYLFVKRDSYNLFWEREEKLRCHICFQCAKSLLFRCKSVINHDLTCAAQPRGSSYHSQSIVISTGHQGQCNSRLPNGPLHCF